MLRLEGFMKIRKLHQDGLSVSEIASRTGLSTSTTCFHLGQLARVGLVESKRKGRSTIYRWSDTRLSMQIEKVTPTSASTTRSAG